MKKILIVLISSFIPIVLLSIYLGFLTDQFLMLLLHLKDGNTFNLKFNLSYIDAMISCVSSQGVRLWTAVYVLVAVIVLMIILFQGKTSLSSVKEVCVTNKIKIPVSSGNGQYGNARFSTTPEKKKMFDTFLFTGEEVPPSSGIVVEMTSKRVRIKKKKMKKKKNLKVSFADFIKDMKGGRNKLLQEEIKYVGGAVNALILGTTSSGKTRRVILQSMWLQMLSGRSIVVSDVKGELFYYTSFFAERHGYNVITLDLRTPQKGMRYNFLQPVLDYLKAGNRTEAISATWDIVSALCGEPKGEPLWHNGEMASIASAILAVCMEAPVENRNLTNVYYFIANMCKMDEDGNMPLSKYLDTLPYDHPARAVFAMAELAAHRTRSSFFTSALGTLKLFTDESIAEMTSVSDFSLKDISEVKSIVYMIIPDEKKTRYSLVSLFITQLYMSQVDYANTHGLTLPIPCDYNLDELGNFPYIPALGAMASAGRSRGVRLNIVLQDYQQIEKKYKEEYETIKTCCRMKLYLKSDNPKTLKEISESLDTYTVEVTSASDSSNKSIDARNSGSISSSRSLASRALLKPAELTLMDSPYALCMYVGYRPSIVTLPDLSKYMLNNIL